MNHTIQKSIKNGTKNRVKLMFIFVGRHMCLWKHVSPKIAKSEIVRSKWRSRSKKMFTAYSGRGEVGGGGVRSPDPDWSPSVGEKLSELPDIPESLIVTADKIRSCSRTLSCSRAGKWFNKGFSTGNIIFVSKAIFCETTWQSKSPNSCFSCYHCF